MQSPHEGHDIIVLSTAMFLVCPGYIYHISSNFQHRYCLWSRADDTTGDNFRKRDKTIQDASLQSVDMLKKRTLPTGQVPLVKYALMLYIENECVCYRDV